MSAPRAAGRQHVNAYLRMNETRALKEAVGDLLGTDRCAVNISIFQVKDPVGKEGTSDSHSFSITA